MAYEVEIKDLRDSAKAAREAATAVGKVRPGAALAGVRTGMPGATCLATVDGVAGDWATELSGWVEAVKGYATTLETNAGRYEQNDAEAATAFASAPSTPPYAARPGTRGKYGPLEMQ